MYDVGNLETKRVITITSSKKIFINYNYKVFAPLYHYGTLIHLTAVLIAWIKAHIIITVLILIKELIFLWESANPITANSLAETNETALKAFKKQI